MSLTKEQIAIIREMFAGHDAVCSDVRTLCDMALRTAEPAQPVAWLYTEKNGRPLASLTPPSSFEKNELSDSEVTVQPLYTSPQMPQMSDEEITLLLAKEMSHAASNGLNMQQMALRLCRAVRGEK